MKLKEVDYEISEELFATSCMLKMLIDEYDEKIPNDVIESIEHSLVLAEKHLAKVSCREFPAEKLCNKYLYKNIEPGTAQAGRTGRRKMPCGPV